MNTIEQENKTSTPSNGATDWWRKLADESWQAELIISGAAIYGSISLPALITQVANWCFLTFAVDKFFLLGMIAVYLYIMAAGLITAFLTHFSIRVLWIGMLGLSSVYPKGILPIPTYSDHFNESLKKEFPDVNSFNHKLDQMGSLIFSIASAGVMVILSSILFIMAVMLVSVGIHMLLPNVPFMIIFGVIIFILIIPGILNSILNLKSLRDRPWTQKYHFKIFVISTKFIYTIFYKPFSYIIYTLISNGNKDKNFVGIIVLVLFMAMGSGVAIGNSNVRYFLNDEAFMRHANPVYGSSSSFYDDQRQAGELILYGSLASDVLSGGIIKTFIPIFGKEDEAREFLCGEYVKYTDAELEADSTLDNRIAKQAFENECLQKYLTVFLNGKVIRDPYMVKFTHPDVGQFGVNLYVPCTDCTLGKNELKISRPYPADAEKPFEVVIPFVYEGAKPVGEIKNAGNVINDTGNP